MAPQFSTTTTAPTPQSTRSPAPNTSPAGSPPLILAFLAVGIFSAAMIAVFGWRRVQFGRDSPVWGPNAAGPHRRRFGDTTDIGLERSVTGEFESSKLEKPVLREVWTDRSTKPDGIDYGFWDNVMPLAVLPARPSDSALTIDQISTPQPSPSPEPLTLLALTSPPSSAGIQSPPLSSPSHPSNRRHRFDGLIPLALLRRHTRPEADVNDPLASDSSASGKGANKDEAPKEAAQVVVLIEMPSLVSSRHRHHMHSYQGHGHQQHHNLYSSLSRSETLVETHDRMREDLLGVESGHFNYSLGVHTCPWPVPASTNPTDER